MSIRIRYLTNGKKSTYVVRNAGVDPITIEFFDCLEDIPESIRHYAPKGLPMQVGPDGAYILGAGDVLYPNFPKCRDPRWDGGRCIAESCALAEPSYRDCRYFDKTYKGV